MNGEVQRLTIGIEEEFQIIDADGQLKSHSETLLGAARPYLEERVKPEGPKWEQAGFVPREVLRQVLLSRSQEVGHEPAGAAQELV